MNTLRIVLLISFIYLTIGILLIGLHKGLTHDVQRHLDNWCQTHQNTGGLNLGETYCADTDDLRSQIQLNWPQWQFLTNKRGFDQADYLPVDIALVGLVAVGSAVIFKRKNYDKA